MNLNQVTLAAIDVSASVAFYLKLGFELIVDAPHYARFKSKQGDATFSVHAVSARWSRARRWSTSSAPPWINKSKISAREEYCSHKCQKTNRGSGARPDLSTRQAMSYASITLVRIVSIRRGAP